MNREDFDKMIQDALPPVAVTTERLERFIDATLDKAPIQPARNWRLPRWPALTPVMRFALPMLAAVILGVTVSRHYEQDWAVDQFSMLYLSTTLAPVGS